MTPTILRTTNLQIKIYPKDHWPPHVHVVGPDCEAKFTLKSFECLKSHGFSRSELIRIIEFLKNHSEDLWSAWYDYQK